MTKVRRRNGFAAAVALCMLAALGGLAAASFYTVVEARRAANRVRSQEQASSAADVGLYAALDRWRVWRLDSLPEGASDSIELVATRGGESVRSRVRVTHVTGFFYWVIAAGESAIGADVRAARIHQLLVEVRAPTFPALAALAARGDVLAAPEAVVAGGDAVPPGWTDCPARDTIGAPSVLIPPGEEARLEDGRQMPDVRADPRAADSATYAVFGGVTTTSLAARADVTIPSGAILTPTPDVDRDCRPNANPGMPGNWGEPGRTGGSPGCERYFPVVHAAGDLTVTGGRGQGVLIVDGRLRIQGPFFFAGLVVVRRGLETDGRDVYLDGAMLSAAPAVVRLAAAGTLRRSTCAVAKAEQGAARPYPEPRRGWAEAF